MDTRKLRQQKTQANGKLDRMNKVNSIRKTNKKNYMNRKRQNVSFDVHFSSTGPVSIVVLIQQIKNGDFDTLGKLLDELKNQVCLNDRVLNEFDAEFVQYLVKLHTRALLEKQMGIVQRLVWCFSNISTASDMANKVLAPLVPALVQYLSNQEFPTLVENAAWTIGNMAADSAELRLQFHQHEAVLALHHLLVQQTNVTKPNVIKTVAWAMSNLARGVETQFKLFTAYADTFIELLKSSDVDVCTEVAWILCFLTAKEDAAIHTLVEHQLPLAILHLMEMQYKNANVMVPVLRMMGNVCSVDCLTCFQTNIHYIERILETHHQVETVLSECVHALCLIQVNGTSVALQDNTCQILQQQLLQCLYSTKQELLPLLAKGSNEHQFESIFFNDRVLAFVLSTFKGNDMDMIYHALSIIDRLFTTYSTRAAEAIDSLDGIEAIESFYYSDAYGIGKDARLANWAERLVNGLYETSSVDTL